MVGRENPVFSIKVTVVIDGLSFINDKTVFSLSDKALFSPSFMGSFFVSPSFSPSFIGSFDLVFVIVALLSYLVPLRSHPCLRHPLSIENRRRGDASVVIGLLLR